MKTLLLSIMFAALGSAHEFRLVKLPNAKRIDDTPAACYIAVNASSNRLCGRRAGGICESLADWTLSRYSLTVLSASLAATLPLSASLTAS
jgi:hypothetical protein